MKLFIVLCFLATLCSAKKHRPSLTIGSEMDKALESLRQAKDMIKESMSEVKHYQRKLMQTGTIMMNSNHMDDVMIVLSSHNKRATQIDKKLKEMKGKDTQAEKCLLAIRENLSNVMAEAFNKIENCRKTAAKKWDRIVTRYDSVINAGRKILKRDYTKMCSNKNQKLMARCIVSAAEDACSIFKEIVEDTHRVSSNSESPIISRQSHCNQVAVAHIQTTSVNAAFRMEMCLRESIFFEDFTSHFFI